MHEHAEQFDSLAVPSAAAAAASVLDAQRMFQRTLSVWAVDALTIRRTGACHLRWTGRPTRAGSSQWTHYRKAA